MDDVRVAVDGSFSPKAEYALEAFSDALRSRDVAVHREDGGGQADVVVGTMDSSERLASLSGSAIDVPTDEESFAVARHDGTLYVAGRDEQGLMYALLELAERVELEGRALDEIADLSESPSTAFRGMYTFLHNEDCDAAWFHSEEHWQAYFDLLARSRYNSFNLVMGHQTNYLSPPFPFFVDVDDHPEVTVPSITDEERERNLATLRYVSNLAEERGIDFVLGVWQVIAWRPETGHYDRVQESMVDGLDWDNLRSYTYAALKTILEACPAIDGVQLRANSESGVPLSDQTEFYRETVFAALEDVDRGVYLDLRGWGAHEETIELARDMDFPLRLSMKYWAEHLGGPYQAPEQSPAYSFADFFKYGPDVDLAYQVWTLGSHRVFVWGDPEYARTFAESLSLGDATGFEICPPLAQKGYGNEPGAWRLLQPDYEHYEWEFERYWLFYRLFGRLTYDADAAEETWTRHLRDRFGDAAEEVLDAYAAASRVLTFVVRFNMGDPNMYLFPEADIGGVMDLYLDVQPTDPALVKSFRQAAAEHVSGEFTARLSPDEASSYLRSVGEECLERAAALENAASTNEELRTTLVDVEALGELALYHAEKIRAVERLALFYETGDFATLDESVGRLESATPHWDRLVEVTEPAYNDHIVTGPIDNLTWADKRPFVGEDVERAHEQRELHRRYGGFTRAFDFGGEHDFDRVELTSYLNRTYEGEQPWLHDFYVERGFTGVTDEAEYGYTVEHGWTDTSDLTATRAPLVRLADKNLDTVRRTTNQPTGWENLEAYGNQLYADHVAGTGESTFVANVTPGRYEVIVVLADRSEAPSDHGPMAVTVHGETVASDLTVPAGEVIDLSTEVELDRNVLRVTFDAADGGDWIATGLVIRPADAIVTHTPPGVVDPTGDVALTASVYRAEDVDAVTVHVRGDDGDGHSIPMVQTGDDAIFRADLPDELLRAGAIVEYWFEADEAGRTTRLPDPADEGDPYELYVARPGSGVSIEHDRVESCERGDDVGIDASVESDGPLQAVRLHYRYANQFYEYDVVEMERTVDGYTASIPGEYTDSKWDVMYFIEAVDEAGNGAFFPGPDPPENSVRQSPYVVIDVDGER